MTPFRLGRIPDVGTDRIPCELLGLRPSKLSNYAPDLALRVLLGLSKQARQFARAVIPRRVENL